MPDWLHYMDQAEVDCLAANTYLELALCAADTPWWCNLVTPLPDEVTAERPNRTFALVELLVGRAWRRHHIAQRIHDRLLAHRTEERATLTVHPEAHAAKAAYRAWGWHQVGAKHNPLPGEPVFELWVRQMGEIHRRNSPA